MKKYWINDNQEVINTAFMKWAKLNFAKWRSRGAYYETYPEISKDENGKLRLAYVYEVSNHYQSSYTGHDEITYEKMCDYEEMDRVVRFYVGLLIPRLKSEYVCEIASLVKGAMKTSNHSHDGSDWYTTYSYDCDAVSLSRIVDISVDYLKEHSMYRDKAEYVRQPV